MARRVLLRSIVRTEIGTLVQPGPNYKGMWARDGMLQVRALLNLGRYGLARDLLRLYARAQLTEATDPSLVLIRRKGAHDWHEGLASYADRAYVLEHTGAFPTNVYDGRGYDSYGRRFRPGAGEIYGETPDVDSSAWWIIEAGDLCERTQDRRTAREFLGRVRLALRFLEGKDTDGDGLLEQGSNEDWADCLQREGQITYTQGVWYAALQGAAAIERLAGSPDEARRLEGLAGEVRAETNRRLHTGDRYAEHSRPDGSLSHRVSQDTAWLLVFGMAPDGSEAETLRSYDDLRCAQGHGIVSPLYDPDHTGPTRMEAGEYHNGGVWTWLTSIEAWARWRWGDAEGGDRLLRNALQQSGETVYEWVHGHTGEPHNPGFATGAAALICALREGRRSLGPAARDVRVDAPGDVPRLQVHSLAASV
jgi:glycogen debranching enzyme